MFPLEQGAFEMILIGAIALIVVGPKDLPMLMRKVGQFTAKMRGLAAEFRASFDEMARQSELDELRKEVEALRTGQYLEPSYNDPVSSAEEGGGLSTASPQIDPGSAAADLGPHPAPPPNGATGPTTVAPQTMGLDNVETVPAAVLSSLPETSTPAKVPPPATPRKPRARKPKDPPAAEHGG